MIFKWETEEEKLARWIKVPPKKKLEWLEDMRRFMCKALTKKQKKDFFRLREAR